jgi:hypothetical protein
MTRDDIVQLVKDAQHQVFIAGGRVPRNDEGHVLPPLEEAYRLLGLALQQLTTPEEDR